MKVIHYLLSLVGVVAIYSLVTLWWLHLWFSGDVPSTQLPFILQTLGTPLFFSTDYKLTQQPLHFESKKSPSDLAYSPYIDLLTRIIISQAAPASSESKQTWATTKEVGPAGGSGGLLFLFPPGPASPSLSSSPTHSALFSWKDPVPPNLLHNLYSSLEVYALPSMLPLYRESVSLILQRMVTECPGSLIFKRYNIAPQLTLTQDESSNHFVIDQGFQRLYGNLANGKLFLARQDSPSDAVITGAMFGGNHVRYNYLGKHYEQHLDSNQNIRSVFVTEIPGRNCIQVGYNVPLYAGADEIALLTIRFSVTKSQQPIQIEGIIEAMPYLGDAIRGLELSLSLDGLSFLENQPLNYTRFFSYPNNETIWRTPKGGFQRLYSKAKAREKMQWFALSEGSEISRGFSIVTIIDDADKLKDVLTSGENERGVFHWVENWYWIGEVPAGSSRQVSERRILQSGSFVFSSDIPDTSQKEFTRILTTRESLWNGVDWSVSLEPYGAQLNGVAALYYADYLEQQKGQREKIAHTTQVKDWMDSHLDFYDRALGGPNAKITTDPSVRSLSMVILAIEKMIQVHQKEKDGERYKQMMERMINRLIKFQVKTEKDKLMGIFACEAGSQTSRFDCHASAILALAKGLVILDEGKKGRVEWEKSLGAGIDAIQTGIRIEENLDTILLGNVIFVENNTPERKDSIFLAYKAGLCARAMKFLEWMSENKKLRDAFSQEQREKIRLLRWGCVSYLELCSFRQRVVRKEGEQEEEETVTMKGFHVSWRNFEVSAESQMLGLLGLVPVEVYQ